VKNDTEQAQGLHEPVKEEALEQRVRAVSLPDWRAAREAVAALFDPYPGWQPVLASSSGPNLVRIQTGSPLNETGVEEAQTRETPDIASSDDDYARRFEGDVGEWFLKVQEDATRQLLRDHVGQTFLDVGGGHGQLTGALIECGSQVTVVGSSGVEGSRIEHYHEQGLIEFTTGNLLELPFPSNSFDVVISFRMLPHLKNWARFLQEMARVARQAVIVDYPEARSVNYLAPFLFPFKKHIEGNTRQYTVFRQAELVEVMEPLGYKCTGRFPQFLLPMVLHRRLESLPVSRRLERVSRSLGLTRRLGSPVILRFSRNHHLDEENR
jgi:2-polyprenyl-3-methyl-5-hydroxy-6-metoxy-1,4-benzoquinol methylase